jgi:hypothetical protein
VWAPRPCRAESTTRVIRSEARDPVLTPSEVTLFDFSTQTRRTRSNRCLAVVELAHQQFFQLVGLSDWRITGRLNTYQGLSFHRIKMWQSFAQRGSERSLGQRLRRHSQNGFAKPIHVVRCLLKFHGARIARRAQYYNLHRMTRMEQCGQTIRRRE